MHKYINMLHRTGMMRNVHILSMEYVRRRFGMRAVRMMRLCTWHIVRLLIDIHDIIRAENTLAPPRACVYVYVTTRDDAHTLWGRGDVIICAFFCVLLLLCSLGINYHPKKSAADK